jgi:hypothetical protein
MPAAFFGYSDVRVIVEFMDGVTRTYGPVGGVMNSPMLTGDGHNVVTLEMLHQSGVEAIKKHVANIPLMNIREYRLEPWNG